MINFDALVLTQIFRRLEAKIYEVHEHLVITLLATLINLQKVLEELFVVRITFLNKNLRQEYGTNPPDGERTADLFLNSLWTKKNLTSMISTHVFSLAEAAPSHVLKLCVPAEKMEDGSLQFDYKVRQGICKVSSVDLLLEKNGLILETAS